MKPLALDLFCCAGGASRGLVDAGFDVVGVDIDDQTEYPYPFLRGDALEVLARLQGGETLTFARAGASRRVELADVAMVWSSPPCQRYSQMTRQSGDADDHPDLVQPTRRALIRTRKLYVIENVVHAPLLRPITLCGEMFGLGVTRHRLFELSFHAMPPRHPKHRGTNVDGTYMTVTGHRGVPSWTYKQRERVGLPRYFEGEMTLDARRRAMGIDWMTNDTLVQAIPPAYARWIATRALARIAR